MNSNHRAIRALITSMSPERAVDFIRAFHLPEKEETCIIEKEVNDLSYTQICRKHGMTPETVKNARARAFAKIADALQYREERGQD